MGPQLLGLPNELLVLILSFLPLRSITACKRSCHRLRAVIKHSGLLRCRIRTMKNYLEDLSPPGFTTLEFIEALKKWEKAWLSFSVEKEAATHRIYKPYPGQGEYGCEFMLRSGYLIQMYEGRLGWSYLDLSLQRDLHEDRSASKWTEVAAETSVEPNGWALDIDQDLVVVSRSSRESGKRRLKIRPLHFTTGICHEFAAAPEIQLEFEGKYSVYFKTHIKIMGDYLVVLIAHGSLLRNYQTLYLVDWVRGHTICHRRVGADTYFPVLAPISSDTFVLGRKRDWALELCRITKEGDGLTFCTLCLLKLPAVHFKTRADLTAFNREFSATTRPSPLMQSRTSALPFRSSPSDSVLSFAVNVRRCDKSFLEIKSLYFYTLPCTLRTLAAAHSPEKRLKNDDMRKSASSWLRRQTRRTPTNPAAVVPWDDWGPKSTRWIVPGGFSLSQELCGMRCAISEWSGRRVRVLDFNPGRIRRVVAVRQPRKNGGRALERLAVTSPSTVPAGRCFLHDIESSLPYFELKKTGVKGNLIMDDEWTAQIQCHGTSDSTGHSFVVHSIIDSVDESDS